MALHSKRDIQQDNAIAPAAAGAGEAFDVRQITTIRLI
jgi:hypothetical protein